MSDSSSVVVRNFLALGGGEALSRLIAFGTTIYLAKALGASGYGVIAFAMAVVLYLAHLADFGIEAMGSAEIAQDRERIRTQVPVLMSARIAFGAVLALLASTTSLLVLPSPDGPIIAVAVLRIVGVAASTRWVHVGLESALPVGVTRITGEGVILALVLILVRGVEDLWAVPLAQVIGEFVIALGLLVTLRWRGRSIPVRWSPMQVAPVARRAWPVVAHSLLGMLIFNADLVMLRFLRDAASVGYYAAAYTLVSFLLNVGMNYGLSLVPTLARLEEGSDAERDLYQTSMAQVLAVVLPTAVGGTLLAGPMIATVFGPGYAQSAGAMQVLLWSMVLSLYRSVALAGLLSRGRQDLLLKTSTWAAILNVGLNLVMIPPFGIIGAGVATAITEGVRTYLGLRYASACGLPSAPPLRHLRTVLASLAMGVGVWWAAADHWLLSVPLGVAVYGVVLGLTGGVRIRGRRPALTV